MIQLTEADMSTITELEEYVELINDNDGLLAFGGIREA